MIRLSIAILFSICLAHSSMAQGFELPEMLPPDLEQELALSALPSHLRLHAGVLLLSKSGYVEQQPETNGFTCLVRRMGAIPGTFSNAILPICYDKEGSETLLPAVKDEVNLLMQGMEPTEVASIIDRGWKSNRFRVPGPGVSYMLSPIFYLNGRDGGYVPHVMFYSPYKTDSDVGASSDRLDYVPFIQGPGRPSAVMVSPVGIQEREDIMNAEQALISKVQAYLNR